MKKSNYELIKDYLIQKGYEGPDLEQAAWQATVKIEAIRTGLDPLLTMVGEPRIMTTVNDQTEQPARSNKK